MVVAARFVDKSQYDDKLQAFLSASINACGLSHIETIIEDGLRRSVPDFPSSRTLSSIVRLQKSFVGRVVLDFDDGSTGRRTRVVL
jgi:hypothetical protein